MAKSVIFVTFSILFILFCLATPEARGDGGYFSDSVAVSADQRAIIVRNGDDISMTFSTGYTGDGNEFSWIIPTPVPPAIEDVREAGEIGKTVFERLDRITAPKVTSGEGCFPAGTMIPTTVGIRAIETVEAGTIVFALDTARGELTTATIVRRLSFPYAGDMVNIRLGFDDIDATGNQPFFVMQGESLETRPAPKDVPAGESISTGFGQWVAARDLRIGDILADRDGEGVAVVDLRVRQETVGVFCLEIEKLHNCAVGRIGVIAHNNGKNEAMVKNADVPPSDSVTVFGRAQLEHYEISILGSSGAVPLLDWLSGNGYRMSSMSREILDSYIQDGWAFVAVKLVPGERRFYENEFLPALTIRYRHDRLVFPLRISSVSTVGPVKLRLYVLAKSTVSSTVFPTSDLVFETRIPDWPNKQGYIEECIERTAGDDRSTLVVLWKGSLATNSDIRTKIDELTDGSLPPDIPIRLTRLEARMGPSEMTRDITLVPDRRPKTFRVNIRTSEIIGSEKWRIPGLTDIASVALGSVHTVVLKEDGTLLAWGQNEYGQIGVGGDEYRSSPVRVGGLEGVTSIASCGSHNAALREDGTVWTWGVNWYGQLGDGSTTDRSIPMGVDGISDVIAITAGSNHVVALKRDGTVWSWGENRVGQLGNGGNTDHYEPVAASGLNNVVNIAAGSSHTLALKADGTVWAWGSNYSYQLGGRTPLSRYYPVVVPGLSKIVAIAAGWNHSLALDAAGVVWAWGRNEDGQLGDGSKQDRHIPVRVDDFSDAVAISAGYNHTVALDSDGAVWAWGGNRAGQLGRGGGDRKRPVGVVGVDDIVAIGAGWRRTAALKEDGTLWGWGSF